MTVDPSIHVSSMAKASWISSGALASACQTLDGKGYGLYHDAPWNREYMAKLTLPVIDRKGNVANINIESASPEKAFAAYKILAGDLYGGIDGWTVATDIDTPRDFLDLPIESYHSLNLIEK